MGSVAANYSPGERAGWRWSGATFGIPGIAGAGGCECLIAASFEADRAGLRHLLNLDATETLRGAEFRVRPSNGSTVHLQCEAYADRPGRRASLCGVMRDVTYDRRFEAELTNTVRHNHLLLATIDACPLSITVADTTQPDTPLIYANRKFLQMSGYEAAEVIGRNCRFLQGPATDRQAVDVIRQAIAAGEQTELELLNYDKSGGEFLNRLLLAPIHDDAGTLTAYIGLQTDVTQEAQRRDTETQRQKMEALGRMMGGVAHEVNNMLQPITLLGQHMLDRDLVLGEGRPLLEIVLESSLKARRIIGELLAFSRPTARSANTHQSVALLQDSLRLVRQAIPPGVALAVHIEGTPPAVAIDHTIFVQIMLNLVTNAVAAMAGAGTLTITLSQHNPAGALLVVADTGCGMDRTVLDRAFEPFFTTKPIGQGTGLGLPMVYGLIREVGGFITLQSAPGRGTTATIQLPGLHGEP